MIGYGVCYYLVTQSLVKGITKSISGTCLVPLHANPDEFLQCKYPDYEFWFAVRYDPHIDMPIFTNITFLVEQEGLITKRRLGDGMLGFYDLSKSTQ